MKKAIIRISTLPFEIAIAALFIISAIAHLGHWGPPDVTLDVLPYWESLAISVLGLLTGLLTIIGVAKASRRFELTGMMFLVGILVIRLLLYANYLGVGRNFIITGVFYSTMLWAAIARVVSLQRGDSLARIRGHDDFPI